MLHAMYAWINTLTAVENGPIKFKRISLNLCPIFHLIFKWKKKRRLLQLCLCFWDYLNYVTNPCPTGRGLGPFEMHWHCAILSFYFSDFNQSAPNILFHMAPFKFFSLTETLFSIIQDALKCYCTYSMCTMASQKKGKAVFESSK